MAKTALNPQPDQTLPAEAEPTPAAVNFDEIPDGQILYVVAVYSNMVNLFTSQLYSKLPAKTPMDEFVRGQLKAEKLAIDPT